ncbi:Laminin subunit alpha [Holothuria leucospilota]|uniref:Laminin subunit alpha n=1 Tax=Holothuria leucospilota TaxID=206669 RepID=A0A9Q1BTX4_HOLLE|nr:Laminin subunit alpha [Holothuria leucospilota]
MERVHMVNRMRKTSDDPKGSRSLKNRAIRFGAFGVTKIPRNILPINEGGSGRYIETVIVIGEVLGVEPVMWTQDSAAAETSIKAAGVTNAKKGTTVTPDVMTCCFIFRTIASPSDPYSKYKECACSPDGVTDDVCDKSTGTCLCKDNFAGSYCDRCATGYFGYPNCDAECGCDTRGSQYEGCSENGLCYCQTGFSGAKCDRCADGYYRYPDCLACDCSRSGSRSIVCDEQNGQCTCRDGYQGRTCDMCAEGFYNYPNCEECNCNPAGVVERSGRPTGRCGQTQGACTCKANVVGRACDSCAPLYFNLARSNPDGCEACNCFVAGTVSGLAHCDQVSGQCLCKPAVDGRRCEECKDGYYRLEAGNAFGCVECGCDVGGSISNVCDKNTGQCLCRPRVTGRACSGPAQLHFFPSLHQIRFEIESGFTPNGRRPRIGYDYKVFPDFSYLGYAVMSSIQVIAMNRLSFCQNLSRCKDGTILIWVSSEFENVLTVQELNVETVPEDPRPIPVLFWVEVKGHLGLPKVKKQNSQEFPGLSPGVTKGQKVKFPNNSQDCSLERLWSNISALAMLPCSEDVAGFTFMRE